MKKKEIIQIAIFLIIGIFLINTLMPFYTGSEQFMIVLSGSMVPLFLPGDFVITKSVDPNELNVGDVVTFQVPSGQPGTFVTHRIISIGKTYSSAGEIPYFQTKGDANNVQDDFKVPATNVLGKLAFVIPSLGLLIDAFKKSKIFFILMVMLPSGILVLDEIRNMMVYSNPRRARKLEREEKKIAKRTHYKIKWGKLAQLILVSGLIFSGVVAFNLGENGHIVLESENKIDNSGFLPMVYTIKPDNPEVMLDIYPWYGVLTPFNETKVNDYEVSAPDGVVAPSTFTQFNEIVVTAPENTPAEISTVPYILPVFWIVEFAEISPYLPAVAEVLIYTSAFALLLMPLWCKKVVRGSHKKKTGFQRTVAQMKRALNLG
ncbi:signal peptidase I [Methanosarcina mazei]|uniref:Signal peptidase I n=2 Tax=Methanosarcina mazei TaxID=2209 RepID=A0A0F8BPT7_METMZ|nr:signal peptidase I [Methanosarcina mazei]AKB39686.1 Signal peptidase I [Methanosarcina mazei WWM610]KKG03430.1 hypothetical protein DU31_00395 [Methanosarcina mazei]KKG05997.1 hypothetical protein DU40_17450 [Methanosarcina mazei]KKH39496.1 hypothetical protein DU54_18695 [Methanosarcina mazei]KKH41555.1 hypothetical protein DU50_01025 [Methanosarcina mazei]